MFAIAASPHRPERCRKWLVGLGLCLALMSGCATTRPSVDLPEISSWDTRQEVLGRVANWEFRGRIAVKAGDEGFNGKFRWTQTGNRYYATVGGPLGIGTVIIEGDGRTVTLTDKDGLAAVLVNPEAELYYRYGWTIPVASLRYWALGIPNPASEALTEIDVQGRLVSLEQNNWAVKISRYRESAGQQMPRILTATSPDTRVRMVIDN